MTGRDDDDDGADEFRAVPHPDDRLWRHPAEIAAMGSSPTPAGARRPAGDAAAAPKRRVQLGILAATGVVIVGAGALTLGVLSTPPSPPRTTAVAASVVTDVGIAAASSGTEDDLAANLYGRVAVSLPRVQAATPAGMREGSGLFVTTTGHIVTSAGLVDGAEYVLAWTEDGRRWEAQVVAIDRFSDIAVIWIDSNEWPPAAIGTDRVLRAGQYALAIDYTAGSMGIGEIASLTETVPIDDGSSATRLRVDAVEALPGSAIFDDAGFVIAMLTSEPGSVAVSADMIELTALELIVNGQADHPSLGVSVDETISQASPVIDMVERGSPAERAGLRVGDAIAAVDGQKITGHHGLWAAVEASSPGDEFELAITRSGERLLITVTLGSTTD